MLPSLRYGHDELKAERKTQGRGCPLPGPPPGSNPTLWTQKGNLPKPAAHRPLLFLGSAVLSGDPEAGAGARETLVRTSLGFRRRGVATRGPWAEGKSASVAGRVFAGEEEILSGTLAKVRTPSGEETAAWFTESPGPAGRGSVSAAYSSRSFSGARLAGWEAAFRRPGLPPPNASPSPRAARARKWMQK